MMLRQHEKAQIKRMLGYRIIKEKLLYCIGIPREFSDLSKLKSESWFGQFGCHEQILVNHNPKNYEERRDSQVAIYVHYKSSMEVALALKVSFSLNYSLVSEWIEDM